MTGELELHCEAAHINRKNQRTTQVLFRSLKTCRNSTVFQDHRLNACYLHRLYETKTNPQFRYRNCLLADIMDITCFRYLVKKAEKKTLTCVRIQEFVSHGRKNNSDGNALYTRTLLRLKCRALKKKKKTVAGQKIRPSVNQFLLYF